MPTLRNPETTKKDIERIKAMPGIESVKETKNYLVITTKAGVLKHTEDTGFMHPIQFRVPNHVYDIEMKYMRGHEGYYHPVINIGRGYFSVPCLGDNSDDIKKAREKGVVPCVETILMVLQTIIPEENEWGDEDDWD